jgi:hypothetical protein
MHITTTHIRALVETTAADMCDEGKIDARQRKAISNINGHSSTTVDKYYMKRSRKHDVEHGKKMFEVLSANDNAFKWKHNDNSYDWNQVETTYTNNDNCYDCNQVGTTYSNNDNSYDWNHAETTNTNQYTNNNSYDWNQNIYGSPSKQAQARTDKEVSTKNGHLWGSLHPELKTDSKRVAWSIQEINYIRSWMKEVGQYLRQNRVKRLLDHIRKDDYAKTIFHVNHIVDGERLRHGIRIVERGNKDNNNNNNNSNNAIYYDPI